MASRRQQLQAVLLVNLAPGSPKAGGVGWVGGARGRRKCLASTRALTSTGPRRHGLSLPSHATRHPYHWKSLPHHTLRSAGQSASPWAVGVVEGRGMQRQPIRTATIPPCPG